MAMKHYPPEFKTDAIALYRSRPGATIAHIAAELGINRETLRGWIRKEDDTRSTHTPAPTRTRTSAPAPGQNLEEENKRLRAQATGTGAQVLGRLRSNRRTPVLTRLHDGSYLSVIGQVRVRIIDARVRVRCSDGTAFTASYRLVTTLTDPRRYPAPTLVGLYHQRWEHESAYYALKHTLLEGRVLRSGDPAGVEQEMWALLLLYQALRTVMVDAAQSRPGTDPDRCCFTVALQAARDYVVRATGVMCAEVVGPIGRRVLESLLPARRSRVSTRKVKSPISRYGERQEDGRPERSRAVTGLDIQVCEPVFDESALPAVSRDERLSPRADHRRLGRVLALLAADSGRQWGARQIAHHLGDITLGSMYRQLSRWARAGLIHKSGPGVYTAIEGS